MGTLTKFVAKNGVYLENGALDSSAGITFSDDGTTIGQLTSTGLSVGSSPNTLLRSDASGTLYLEADHTNSYASSSIVFRVDADEKARLDSTGFGVGTTTPTTKLHVVGTATEVARFQTTNSTSRVSFLDSTTTTSPKVGSTGNHLVFEAGGSERARLTSSGVLAVGSTIGATFSRVTVVGNGNSIALGLGASGNGGHGEVASNPLQGLILRANAYYDTGTLTSKATVTGFSPELSLRIDTGAIVMSTVPTSQTADANLSGLTERMRITAEGKVGIGTSTPSTALHIGGIGAIPNTSNRGLTISTIDLLGSTGNAGVYLSAPFNSGSVNDAFFRVKRGAGDLFNGAEIGFNRDFRLIGSLTEDSLERLRVDSAGNVGIGGIPGTWGSSYRAVHVNSGGGSVASSSRGIDVVNNAVNDGTNWRYVASAPASRYLADNGQHVWYTAPSGTAGAIATFSQAMAITSAGLDIGVDHSIKSGKTLILNNNANTSTATLSFATSELVTTIDSVEAMRINSLRYVGINVTNPLSHLHVGGDIQLENANYLKSRKADSTRTRVLGINQFDYLHIGSPDASLNGIVFTNNGTSMAEFNSGGVLGIGVTPESWESPRKVLRIGSVGSINVHSSSNAIQIANNYYNPDGTNRFITTGYATRNYQNLNGQHIWESSSASGNAGDPITFNQTFSIGPNGQVLSNSAYRWGTSIGLGHSDAMVNKRVIASFPAGNFNGIVEITTNRPTNDSSSPMRCNARFTITRSGGVTGSFAFFSVDTAEVDTNFANLYQWYFDSATGIAYLVFGQSGNSYTWYLETKFTGTISNVVPTVYIGLATSPSGVTVSPNRVIGNATVDNTLAISTGGSERLRIDSSGNVGIGAIPPSDAVGNTLNINNGFFGGLFGPADHVYMSANAKPTTSIDAGYTTWKYKNSAYAALFDSRGGSFRWLTAPSGTAGNAITWTQAMTLNSSGFLGIGTTSPASALHVSGGTNFSITSDRTDNTLDSSQTHLSLRRGTGAGNGAQINSIGGGANDVKALAFAVGGSERVRIDSSGNVGIGTTTPTSTGNYRVTEVRSSDATSGGMLIVGTSDSSGVGRLYSTSTQVLLDDSGSSSDVFIKTNGSNPVMFGTQNTERMRIDTNGNLAVGTTSAYSASTRITAQNDSSGDTTIFARNTNSTGASGFVANDDGGTRFGTFGVINTASTLEATTFGSPGEVFLRASSSAIGVTYATANNSGYHRFLVGSGANSERMRIDSSGNVGIGTSVTSGGTGNTTIEGKLIVASPGVDKGSLFLPYVSSSYAGFKIAHGGSNTSGAADYTDFKLRPSVSSGVATVADSTVIRFVNSYPRTYVDVALVPSGGKVGIGTTSPAEALHILGGATDASIRLQNTASGSKVWNLTAGGGGNYFAGNFAIRNVTDSITPLQINSNGIIGVNTVPSSWGSTLKAIDISSGASFYNNGNAAGVGSNTYYNGTVWIAKNTGASSLYQVETGNHQWYSADSVTAGAGQTMTSRMLLTQAGDLGVGTTSPQAKVHVIGGGGGTEALRISSNGTNSRLSVIARSDGTGFDLRMAQDTDGSNNKDLTISTGSTERIRLMAGGNVGIGTSSPSAKLHVIGSEKIAGNGNLLYLDDTGGVSNFTGMAFRMLAASGSLTRSAFIDLRNENDVVTANMLMTQNSDGGSSISWDLTPSGARTADRRHLVGGFYCGDRESTFYVKGTADNSAINLVSNIQSSTGASFIEIGHSSATVSGDWYSVFRHNGSLIGSIAKNGTTSVSYNTTSDVNLKKNIRESDDAGNLIDQIRVVQYDWKEDDSHVDYGVVAQELYDVFPSAVTPGGTDRPWSWDASFLVPMLVKELQSLRRRVAELESR